MTSVGAKSSLPGGELLAWMVDALEARPETPEGIEFYQWHAQSRWDEPATGEKVAMARIRDDALEGPPDEAPGFEERTIRPSIIERFGGHAVLVGWDREARVAVIWPDRWDNPNRRREL